MWTIVCAVTVGMGPALTQMSSVLKPIFQRILFSVLLALNTVFNTFEGLFLHCLKSICFNSV